MKVSIFNNKKDVLYDPIEGRPFSFNSDKFDYTENFEEADYILGHLHFRSPNESYDKIKKSSLFKKYKNKFVFFSMHDKPRFAYLDKQSIKFICQPLHGPEKNKEFNIIPTPLQMRHFEYELIKDEEFIKEYRNQERKYDFIFIGSTNNGNRSWLEKIKLSNYKLDKGKSVFKVKDVDKRVKMLKDFCKKIAQSKFGFAPSGVGSSSFRLYQCMMMGTIPIIHDMKDYPFKEFIDWSEISIINPNREEISKLPQKIDIEKMRNNCVNAWEIYFKLPNTDKFIFDKYLDKNDIT